jgi:hypothetical protein
MLPEWLVGEPAEYRPESDDARTFLIHTAAPRFIAEIFDEGDNRGILENVSYCLQSGQSLSRFTWIDEPPEFHPPSWDFLDLMKKADRAITMYDEELNNLKESDDEAEY